MSQHYYNRAGVLVQPWEPDALPSPSTILGHQRDPEMEALRNMQGEEKMDEIMAHTSARGTRIHTLCERWVKGEYLEFEEFEDIDFFVGFQNWCELNQPAILESELFVESEKYKYRGRLDLVVKLDGDIWVIDIKTGMFRHKHGLQLKFYQQAYLEKSGIAARMGVLGLTDKNKCGYRKLKETREPLADILAPIRSFNWWRRKHPAKAPAVADPEAIWKI